MGQSTDIRSEKISLQKFQILLQTPPPTDEIRTNQHAGNTLYLPISFVEMKLDELFFGLWETRDFKWQVVGNEIIGSLVLRVFHPVANQWIERTGASATMIRLQKGASVTDVSSKIFNALEMDFPHLKADCLVNAAKGLGKVFGRDLNRKYADVYRPIITGHAVQNGAITAQVQLDTQMSEAVLTVQSMIEQARMDDQTLQCINIALSNCETPSQVYSLIDTIKLYMPEPTDPAKQFKQRMKHD